MYLTYVQALVSATLQASNSESLLMRFLFITESGRKGARLDYSYVLIVGYNNTSIDNVAFACGVPGTVLSRRVSRHCKAIRPTLWRNGCALHSVFMFYACQAFQEGPLRSGGDRMPNCDSIKTEFMARRDLHNC